eukprot:TRINITY_DN80723_c0_g1_i1.p1 TRINITY_DN80723_c0_g1~~TRINITY_DN80723_c0_g1_i1.p1  ORF type:complete len:524 (-),score=123.13 TRINITY_DN80723_c0_g1_i1:121-1692(-)
MVVYTTGSTSGDVSEGLRRCRTLLSKLPPMEGSVKYKRAWSVEESLEQHQGLMRQHELQSQVGQNHLLVRKAQVDFARQEAVAASKALKELLTAPGTSPQASKMAAQRAREAASQLRLALKLCALEEKLAREKTSKMEEEIEKSNKEMNQLKEGIDDMVNGGGPLVVGMPGPGTESGKPREYFYCADCHVGGHGQRFCNYLLKRPNWRVYPSEKWFEDKGGQVSHCPLGRRGVDFTDETIFSRISIHLKGRIWLEDKRKLYEFVPHLMPKTFVIQDQVWVGEVPVDNPDEPILPWFVKETDRNWGTSVVCCAKASECMSLTKPQGTYVVQKHISRPLLYDNPGEYGHGGKLHIKFYNLIYGMDDGQTWQLFCYKDGYLCISPRPWSGSDLTKEGQVTIIRTRRINDWVHWDKVYPLCTASMAEVIKTAVEHGKLEGRPKKQFEIISADFMVDEDFKVYLLEFNAGPVLKDPEDHPTNNDAGMIMGALHIVEPWEQGDINKWDKILECKGKPLKPEDIPQYDVI